MSAEILLTLNGIPLSFEATRDVDQTYEPIGGIATLRFANGAALRQARWRRLRTTITASGPLPAALAAVDWDSPVTLGCIGPRGITQAGNVFTLPAARRADAGAEVFAHALLANGTSQAASVALVGHVATVTPVSGAIGYTCYWHPLITVLSDGPRERFDLTQGGGGWEITAEEI